MKNLLAQAINIANQPINGPLVGIETVADVITKLVSFIYPLASILLFLFLVAGGYQLLLSGGNPEKLKGAKGKITSAIIGFVLLTLSFFLVKVIAYIFGIGEGIF